MKKPTAAPKVTGSLDGDAPWTWRLPDVIGLLGDRQRRYVELLPRLFRVKTAAGHVVPYDLQPYQAWWHAHSPLAMGTKAPNRLAEKGRNLGLTLMAAMDALLLAHRSDRITIPVAGRAGDTSDEFIQKTWDLIRDAREPVFDPRHDVTARVELGNGSSIIPLPGGSPDKSRSKRIVHAVLDEFAFHEYPERLLKAITGSQMEGGTLDIISTHNGADTVFFQLAEDSRRGRAPFMHFYLPAHDPKAWRQDVPMADQVKEGLRLVSPWLSLSKMEDLRVMDPSGYAQEMLCDVMDAGLNLLSRELVARATNPDLKDWGLPYVGAHTRLEPYTVPRRPAGDLDPCVVGVDFARAGDLSAWTAWSATGEGNRQRWLEVLRNTPTPDQNEFMRKVDRELRPSDILIDMTGEGAGLYDYAKDDQQSGRIRARVHGVHFAQTIHVGGGKTTPVKKAIALNLSRALAEGGQLLGSSRHVELQRRHLLAVRRADLDAPRNQDGHADLLWANGLALWGIQILGATGPTDEEPSLDLAAFIRSPNANAGFDA